MALLLPTKQMCLIDPTSMTPRLLMRSMLASTLIFVAAGTSATAQMTAPSTAGSKPKPVTTVPIRPALQTPADTANAMAQAERLALQVEPADRRDPDPAVAAQAGQSDHRKTCRAGEEGARRPPSRLHRGQAGL